jgi:L-2-hydroxyglutarate oxidase LhgO
MYEVQCLVIGAGIVGLACAKKLAEAGIEVVILEAADSIGTETSSRNSEVIHAGIYYPKGSLKARHCVAGKKQLYRYCESHGVPYRRLGKLIVAATEEEIPLLKGIQEKALANGVEDLRFLSRDEIKMKEPEIQVKAALFSPSTGIIDSHAFMLAMLGDAEIKGAMLAVKSKVLRGVVIDPGHSFIVATESGEEEIKTKLVINSAGLSAPMLAHGIQGMPKTKIPKAFYCKGNYFTLEGPSPFKHLVYPVPNSAGLGVHVTLDMAGQARFGPDTEWIEHPEYDVDIKRAEVFYEAIRRYWPGLKDSALQPGYVGVRPKIAGSNDPSADFLIQGPKDHGIAGLVNLFGIESPGLTAALSIADHVYCLLTEQECYSL